VIAKGTFGIEAREAEGLLSENPEEALDLVEPGSAGRRVVEGHLRMLDKPSLDVGRAVRRRVVEDDMQFLLGINAHDVLHETQKVHRRVRLRQLVRDLSRGHFKRGVEIDDAVALVVVRGELLIATDLVCPHQMRLEAVLSQKLGDAAAGEADRLAEQPRSPAASAGGRVGGDIAS
jgi:hypothetical protein